MILACLVQLKAKNQVSDVEGDLEIVKPYQFEPVASDSPAESDTEPDEDSGDEQQTGKNLHG